MGENRWVLCVAGAWERKLEKADVSNAFPTMELKDSTMYTSIPE